MQEVVNVISLPNRLDRMESFKQQAKEQGFSFRVWNGIVDLAAVFRGISMAHNQPIREAKQRGLKRCIVCEDDINFIGGRGAFDYFMDNIPEDYDLYLGMIYEGEIDENNRIVKNAKSFSGLTIYVCHERFYEEFLNMKILAHKDKELGHFCDKYKYIVCDKFIAKQANGYSDQKKKDCNYDKYLVGRKLFGV